MKHKYNSSEESVSSLLNWEDELKIFDVKKK